MKNFVQSRVFSAKKLSVISDNIFHTQYFLQNHVDAIT